MAKFLKQHIAGEPKYVNPFVKPSKSDAIKPLDYKEEPEPFISNKIKLISTGSIRELMRREIKKEDDVLLH